MMTFWAVAALALVVALWFVVPTLVGDRKGGRASVSGSQRAEIEQQIAAIETDVERGVISRESGDRARQSLEASLQSIDTPDTEAAARRPMRWGGAVVALGLPAAAVALYLQLGGGQQAVEAKPMPVETTAGSRNDSTSVTSRPHTTGSSNLSVEEAAARLADRLKREPNDADGWQLLASSYEYLGRTKEAAEAAAKATALRGSGASGASPATPPADKAAALVDARQLVDIVSVGPAATSKAEAGDSSIEDLEAATRARPDDAQAWIALGRAFQSSKRYTNAAQAYGTAAKLTPGDASLLADYADVLAAANGGWLPGEPMQWVDNALALDPSQPKALWLAATAATQQKDPARAITLWERLQGVLPAGSADAEAVAANLAEARNATQGVAPTSTGASDGASSGAVIRGTVKLAPEFADAVAADDTVFIYARAAEGPRMPLAVVRKQVRDLPISFVLDDSMAMAPSMRLSDFPRVIVGARVSKSGNAMPQPGDLEGLTEAMDASGAPQVDIVIDRKNS